MTSSLATRAHARIIEMILSGALNPGDVLQEAKLGVLLDMSRTPVREAIKRIEAEGLAKKEGRFLRVRNLLPKEVEEIFFLRDLLETHAARVAVALPHSALDAIEARIVDLMRAGPSDVEEEHRVDDDFHRLLTESTRNATLVSTIADLRLRTCMFDAHLVPQRFLRGCEEHLGVIAALRSADAELAGARMSQHIAHARDAILERLEKYRGGRPQ